MAGLDILIPELTRIRQEVCRASDDPDVDHRGNCLLLLEVVAGMEAGNDAYDRDTRDAAAAIAAAGGADTDCWANLLRQRDDEQRRRVYYQDIVYSVCNAIDTIERRNITKGKGTVCGTVESPTTEVQDAMLRIMERWRTATPEGAQESI